ncbi:MAG TPA: TetR/AcrR family transcriptional regulator [Solirubrobacterales bacterium]|nr:TetR/AcrR family transcriptional regulator [Solirubrobacterales bacterium]
MSRIERRKAKTAGAILDAAEQLFLERGFAATTMEDLSAAADVAVGSIYSHFGDKEGVYAGLIDRALELDREYSEAGFEQGSSPLERFVGLGEGYLRFAREHPGYFRLFRFPPQDRPGARGGAQAEAKVAQRINEETKRMAGLLEEAIAEGVVRKVDPLSTARFLWAAWDGVIASHLGPANMDLSDEEFEQVLNRARETIVLGIVNPER